MYCTYSIICISNFTGYTDRWHRERMKTFFRLIYFFNIDELCTWPLGPKLCCLLVKFFKVKVYVNLADPCISLCLAVRFFPPYVFYLIIYFFGLSQACVYWPQFWIWSLDLFSLSLCIVYCCYSYHTKLHMLHMCLHW